MRVHSIHVYLVIAIISMAAMSGCWTQAQSPLIQPVVKPVSENKSTNTASLPVNINYCKGNDLQDFNTVLTAFDKMIADGLHRGAQLAVYKDGKPALILAGGRDVRTGRPVNEKSLFSIRSTTKSLAALIMAVLYERGLFKYDDPIVKYWPEFGRNGKENITITQVMSHSAGIPQTPQVPVTSWMDREAVAKAIEELKPAWVPGTRFGYHASTYGWVVDELAQRLTGLNIAGLLQQEVTKPMRITDVYLGLPESEYARF